MFPSAWIWNVGTINVNYILGNKESIALFSGMSVLNLLTDSTNVVNWVTVPYTLCLQGGEETERGAAVPTERLWDRAQRKTTQVYWPLLSSFSLRFCFILWLIPIPFPPPTFPQSPYSFISPPNHPLPLLPFSSPSPSSRREVGILASAEICSCICWGDLRLHKVPVTQHRVSCEAGATDGSTP